MADGSIRVAEIGKHQFAWGLTWIRTDSKKPREVAKEQLDPASKWIYASIAGDDGSLSFGYAEAPLGKRQRIYSYAAALAQIGSDGIYVAPIDDDHLWYVVILNRSVVEATDAIEGVMQAAQMIERLRTAFALPVIIAEGFELAIEHGGTFDPEAVIAAPALLPMAYTGGSSALKNTIALGAMVAAVAGVFWWLFSPDEVPFVDTSAAEAEAQRISYLEAMRGELERVPSNTSWASNAIRLADGALPISRGGWSLREVTCVPGGCSGSYVAAKDAPSSLSYLASGFPEGRVASGESLEHATVSIPVDLAAGLVWDDAMIEAGFAYPAALVDVVGSLPLRVPGLTAADAPVQQALSEHLNPPPHFAPMYRQTIRLAGVETVNAVKVRYVTSRLADFGFSPTFVGYTTGLGSTRPAWEIEFTRITGVAH